MAVMTTGAVAVAVVVVELDPEPSGVPSPPQELNSRMQSRASDLCAFFGSIFSTWVRLQSCYAGEVEGAADSLVVWVPRWEMVNAWRDAPGLL
jgi:hypothetical protein